MSIALSSLNQNTSDIWCYAKYKGFIFTFHQGNLTQTNIYLSNVINFDVAFIQLLF